MAGWLNLLEPGQHLAPRPDRPAIGSGPEDPGELLEQVTVLTAGEYHPVDHCAAVVDRHGRGVDEVPVRSAVGGHRELSRAGARPFAVGRPENDTPRWRDKARRDRLEASWHTRIGLWRQRTDRRRCRHAARRAGNGEDARNGKRYPNPCHSSSHVELFPSLKVFTSHYDAQYPQKVDTRRKIDGYYAARGLGCG